MSAELDADRKDVLDQLSPEERAAIDDGELSPDEKAALKNIAGTDDEDDEDDGDDGEGEAAVTPPAAKTEAAVTSSSAEDEDAPPFKPRYQVELPADLDDQLAALADKETELAQKMKDGELDVADFLTEQNTVARDRAKLEGLRERAAYFEELNRQNLAQEWQWNVDTFMRKVSRKEGIDYGADKEKCADFDVFVKTLASKPENQDKPFEWYLTEAHKRVKALHGIGEKPKAEDLPKPKDGKPTPRKVATDKLPATLANVPGGDGPGDVGDNEFQDLDNLTGLEYETALARMSKEQRERYLLAA